MHKRIITILTFTILLIPGFASAQDARFPLNPPPGYYGSITVNGQPAAAGTTITAMIGGEMRGSITTGPGIYGDDMGPTKLWIRSYQNEPGSTVTFYVSGVAAQQTAKLPDAGITNKADLTFVGVPVPAQAGMSSGSSGDGSSSSSSGGNSSSGVGVVNATLTPSTTTAPGSNQSGITPEVIGTPSKLLGALDASPLAALPTNPAAIIGVVILLISIVIAALCFRKK